MNRLKLILEAYAGWKNAKGACAIPRCSRALHSVREVFVEQAEDEVITIRAKVCETHDVDGVELGAP